MTQMSKRERCLRTMNFQETDRVPIYDIYQNDAIIEYLTGEALTVSEGDRVKGAAIGKSLDMTRMPDGPDEPGDHVHSDGTTFHHERWTLWLIKQPWDDRAGLLEWVKRQIDHVEAQVFDRAYAEAFCARQDRFQGFFGDDTVQVVESGVGLTEVYWALGWEWFAELTADEPELLDAWLAARHRAELRRVAAIADPQRIPCALTYDDIAYKNTLLISPRWLRKYWVPRLKQLVTAWHSRDVKCLFHSDGNLWSILDDLVDAGIDGLNPIEVAAGMTVAEVRQKYPQLFLTGGVDVSHLLPHGTPEEVRSACRENIAATDHLGYFLGSSTELDWEIPLENVLAMLRAGWES
jgi:uroporphyrinogen decarboxylase